MSNDAMREALEQIKDLVSSPRNSWRWITNEGSVIWRGVIEDLCSAALAALSAAPAQPVAWTARWHGSNPERGWSIYAGRDCIAYIGGDEGMSEAISEIVAAHNKCFDCDGGPCVMNCSGRASRISDATKGGEANPDAQSEAKPVEFKYPDFTEWWYTQDVIDEDEPSARGLARRIFNDARAIDPRPSAPATHTHRFAIDPSSDEHRCVVCGREPESVPAGDGGDAESVTMDMLSTAEMNEYFRLLGAYLEVALGNAAGDRHDSTLPTHDALRDYVATVFARRKVRHAPAGADALTDDEIVALAAPYCDDSGWMNGDQIFAFARAVFAKRGGA